jgi:hypothetical protein
MFTVVSEILKIYAARSSEMSINIYHTTRRTIPEDSAAVNTVPYSVVPWHTKVRIIPERVYYKARWVQLGFSHTVQKFFYDLNLICTFCCLWRRVCFLNFFCLLGKVVEHSPSRSVEVKNGGAIPPLPIFLHNAVLNYIIKYRDSLTFTLPLSLRELS